MTYMYKTRSTMKFCTCNTINAYTKQIYNMYLYTSDLYPYCSERTLPSNVKSVFKLKSPLTCTVHIHIIIDTQSYAQLEIKCMISLFTVRRIITCNCTFERNYSCIYSVHTPKQIKLRWDTHTIHSTWQVTSIHIDTVHVCSCGNHYYGNNKRDFLIIGTHAQDNNLVGE